MEVKTMKIIFQLAHYVHVLTDQWLFFSVLMGHLKICKVFLNVSEYSAPFLHIFSHRKQILTPVWMWIMCTTHSALLRNRNDYRNALLKSGSFFLFLFSETETFPFFIFYEVRQQVTRLFQLLYVSELEPTWISAAIIAHCRYIGFPFYVCIQVLWIILPFVRHE